MTLIIAFILLALYLKEKDIRKHYEQEYEKYFDLWCRREPIGDSEPKQ